MCTKLPVLSGFLIAPFCLFQHWCEDLWPAFLQVCVVCIKQWPQSWAGKKMRDLISCGANRDEALFAWGHAEIWCRIGAQVFSDHRMILLRCFSQCVLISPSCWFLTAAVLSLYHLSFIPWLVAEAENPIRMWIQWFLLNVMWLFLKVGLCRFLFKVVIIVWWGCICLVSLLKVSV